MSSLRPVIAVINALHLAPLWHGLSAPVPLRLEATGFTFQVRKLPAMRRLLFGRTLAAPLPLVGRGEGWGALSRKLYERQIDAWSGIKTNGCPEPMDTLADGEAFPPTPNPSPRGGGGLKRRAGITRLLAVYTPSPAQSTMCACSSPLKGERSWCLTG